MELNIFAYLQGFKLLPRHGQLRDWWCLRPGLQGVEWCDPADFHPSPWWNSWHHDIIWKSWYANVLNTINLATCDCHMLQMSLIWCHVLVRPWRLLSIWWYGWPSGSRLSSGWGCARRRPLWWRWVLDSRKRTRYCYIPRNIASTVINDVVSLLCSLDELH